MNGCESCSIKKAECQKIDAFELWCWRRLLRVPWTARRSNQSILKEISLEYSVEGLMLKLKLQYSGHLMWKSDSLEKTQMLGKIEGRRGMGWQRMRWLEASLIWCTWVWASSGTNYLLREAGHASVYVFTSSQPWVSDWMEWLNIQTMAVNFCLFYFLRLILWSYMVKIKKGEEQKVNLYFHPTTWKDRLQVPLSTAL